jgi:hypothetical protein
MKFMANIAAQQQVIYQADPSMVESLKSIRVGVQSYEGILIHADARHVYLSTQQDPYTRQFFNPAFQAYQYNNVILPLVLYELLVISLL